MSGMMTDTDIPTCVDVDLLWTEFLTARRGGDEGRAELLRARMAQLQEQRALREMDDDQLLAQIANLERRDQADGDIDLTARPPGPVARLSALLDEAARRDL